MGRQEEESSRSGGDQGLRRGKHRTFLGGCEGGRSGKKITLFINYALLASNKA